MSLALLDAAFDADALRGSVRNVLLVLCHHAHRETREAFPRVDLIARRTQLSQRQVQYHLRSLERFGVLDVIDPGHGRGRSRRWRVDAEAVAAARTVATWEAWKEKVQRGPEEKVQSGTEKGALHAGARKEPSNPSPQPPTDLPTPRESAPAPPPTAPSLPGLGRGEEGLGALGQARGTAAGRDWGPRAATDEEIAEGLRARAELMARYGPRRATG